jgi:hypothetical protein
VGGGTLGRESFGFAAEVDSRLNTFLKSSLQFFLKTSLQPFNGLFGLAYLCLLNFSLLEDPLRQLAQETKQDLNLSHKFNLILMGKLSLY